MTTFKNKLLPSMLIPPYEIRQELCVEIRGRSLLKQGRSDIAFKQHLRVALLIHIDKRTKRVATLFTSFPTIFLTTIYRSPYFPISTSSVFFNILFLFSILRNIFSSYFTDAVVAFKITSCSDSFYSTVPLDTV